MTEETGSPGVVDAAWGIRVLRSVIQRLTGIGEDFAYKDYGSPYDWQYECTASKLYVGATGVKGENRQVVLVGKTDEGEPVEATCTYSGAHSYNDRCTAVVEFPVRGVLDADYGHYESGQGTAPQYITFCVHPQARAMNTAQEDGLAVIGQSLDLRLPGNPPSHEVTFSDMKPGGVCAQKAYIQWEFNNALDLS